MLQYARTRVASPHTSPITPGKLHIILPWPRTYAYVLAILLACLLPGCHTSHTLLMPHSSSTPAPSNANIPADLRTTANTSQGGGFMRTSLHTSRGTASLPLTPPALEANPLNWVVYTPHGLTNTGTARTLPLYSTDSTDTADNMLATGATGATANAPPTKLPLIIFLHGRGECGGDGWKQVSQGLGRAIMQNCERWPAVVLFPQKPEQEIPWDAHAAQVLEGIATAQQIFDTDPDRVYLTGLSQGGRGTWFIAAASPRTFAAIVPICGFIEPASLVPALVATPIWCFHGGADSVIHPDQSRAAVAGLRAAGAVNIEYTEFAGVDHNSWDPAYADPTLAQWLFAQRRKPQP